MTEAQLHRGSIVTRLQDRFRRLSVLETQRSQVFAKSDASTAFSNFEKKRHNRHACR